MEWAKVYGYIHGLPFIDDTFAAGNLASLVCLVRAKVAGQGLSPDGYLSPKAAAQLYQAPEIMRQHALNTSQLDKLKGAIGDIVRAVPAWAQLFAVPVDYRFLDEPVTSSSNPMRPQRVLLGERAFDDPDALREALVHEVSHVWYGMVSEICDLQGADRGQRFILPSGTQDKDARNVAFAATFAASAVRYYEALGERLSQGLRDRRLYLRRYVQGTLDLLDEAQNLSDSGRAVLDSLRMQYPKEISNA